MGAGKPGAGKLDAGQPSAGKPEVGKPAAAPLAAGRLVAAKLGAIAPVATAPASTVPTTVPSAATVRDTAATDEATMGNTVLVLDRTRHVARDPRPTVTLGTDDTPAGARVILFPTRSVAPPPPPPQAGTAQQRLTKALASLDAALAEQRTAMVGWRESLDHLRKATTGLGLSMQRYQRTLGKLGADVSDLHAQAVRLERWADDALAQSGTPAPKRADAGVAIATAKPD